MIGLVGRARSVRHFLYEQPAEKQVEFLHLSRVDVVRGRFFTEVRRIGPQDFEHFEIWDAALSRVRT